jgi:hypothetical protein
MSEAQIAWTLGSTRAGSSQRQPAQAMPANSGRNHDPDRGSAGRRAARGGSRDQGLRPPAAARGCQRTRSPQSRSLAAQEDCRSSWLAIRTADLSLPTPPCHRCRQYRYGRIIPAIGSNRSNWPRPNLDPAMPTTQPLSSALARCLGGPACELDIYIRPSPLPRCFPARSSPGQAAVTSAAFEGMQAASVNPAPCKAAPRANCTGHVSAPAAARGLRRGHAAVYADGQTVWVPAQNRFIELPPSHKSPPASCPAGESSASAASSRSPAIGRLPSRLGAAGVPAALHWCRHVVATASEPRIPGFSARSPDWTDARSCQWAQVGDVHAPWCAGWHDLCMTDRPEKHYVADRSGSGRVNDWFERLGAPAGVSGGRG